MWYRFVVRVESRRRRPDLAGSLCLSLIDTKHNTTTLLDNVCHTMSVVIQHLTVDLMVSPSRRKGSYGAGSGDRQRDQEKSNSTGPGRFHENSVQLVVLIVNTSLEQSGSKIAGLVETITECLFVGSGQGQYTVELKRKVHKTNGFPDQSAQAGMQAGCIVQSLFSNQPNGSYMSCSICYWTQISKSSLLL